MSGDPPRRSMHVWQVLGRRPVPAPSMHIVKLSCVHYRNSYNNCLHVRAWLLYVIMPLTSSILISRITGRSCPSGHMSMPRTSISSHTRCMRARALITYNNACMHIFVLYIIMMHYLSHALCCMCFMHTCAHGSHLMLHAPSHHPSRCRTPWLPLAPPLHVV